MVSAFIPFINNLLKKIIELFYVLFLSCIFVFCYDYKCRTYRTAFFIPSNYHINITKIQYVFCDRVYRRLFPILFEVMQHNRNPEVVMKFNFVATLFFKKKLLINNVF